MTSYTIPNYFQDGRKVAGQTIVARIDEEDIPCRQVFLAKHGKTKCLIIAYDLNVTPDHLLELSNNETPIYEFQLYSEPYCLFDHYCEVGIRGKRYAWMLLEHSKANLNSVIIDYDILLRKFAIAEKSLSEQYANSLVKKEVGSIIGSLMFAAAKKTVQGNRISATGNQVVKQIQGGFADVAGMSEIKKVLKESILDVLKYRDKAAAFGITPTNGILLYGPPGNGKSYIAEKFAEEAEYNCMHLKPSDFASSYLHGTQELIADFFKKAEKKAPVIVVIDELDALIPRRDAPGSAYSAEEINEWLVQLEKASKKGIFIIATTNRPEMLDPAAIRSGRIETKLFVPLPSTDDRQAIFAWELSKCSYANGLNTRLLAEKTDGFTASDISKVVKDALHQAFQNAIHSAGDSEVLNQKLLENIVDKTIPSVSKEELANYERVHAKMVSKPSSGRKKIGFTCY